MGQIRDVMTSNPTTCEPSATVVDAAKVMAREDIGSVPIVEGGRLVGLVTDRDIIVRTVSEGRDVKTTTVQDVASKDLVTVTPDEDLGRALQLMGKHQVRRIPVVEGDRVVGIVAQADVARAADDEKTGEVVQQISE
jgi:CBS domain-containing protein